MKQLDSAQMQSITGSVCSDLGPGLNLHIDPHALTSSPANFGCFSLCALLSTVSAHFEGQICIQ